MSVSSVKNLNGESFSAVQDAELTDIVSSNSALWNAVSSKADSASLYYYVPISGVSNDESEYQSTARIGSDSLSFSTINPTSNSNTYYSNNGDIEFYEYSAGVGSQIRSLHLNSENIAAYKSSALGSAASGSYNLDYYGVRCRSYYGDMRISLADSELLYLYRNSPYDQGPSYLSFSIGSGPSYSAANTAIGQFYVYITSDINVPRNNPQWVVKNGSGDGFSIGASEAKGFDKDGNTIWSTKMSKATQLIHGGTDPNPAILLTPMQTTTAYTAQWSSAPYVSADYNSLTISYGPTANVPNIKIMPDGITAQILTGNSAKAQFGLFANGVRFDTSAGTWSLTDSVQKREIEGDSTTSAITAIAGSAVGTYNETVLFDGVISSNETAMLTEPASAFERIKVYGYLDSDFQNQYYPWYTEFTTTTGNINAGAWTNDPFYMNCFCFIINPSGGFINATGRHCAFGLTAWDVIDNWATTKVIGINRKSVVAEEQTEE